MALSLSHTHTSKWSDPFYFTSSTTTLFAVIMAHVSTTNGHSLIMHPPTYSTVQQL